MHLSNIANENYNHNEVIEPTDTPMDQKTKDHYIHMSDGELIARILAKPCDANAADYLILQKYNPLLRKIYLEIYDLVKGDYFEDCKSELLIYLMGKDLSWSKLNGIEEPNKFCSWLTTTARRFFRSVKPKMIDISSKAISIDEENTDKPKIQIPVDVERLYENLESKAIVQEAMTMLKENELFCIWMHLKGYAHKDIAEMLRIKWEREGIVVRSSLKNGGFVTPDAGYVNVCIQRAKKEIIKYYNKVYNID